MSKTYCTYRITIATRERVQVEKWNSLHQSLGDPSGAFRYLEKSNELAPLLTRASNDELNSSNEVRRLGEALFDILFDDKLCRDFVGFYEQVIHRDRQLLRIELVIDEHGMPEVAALPWEFLCLPEQANLGTLWLSTAPEVVFSRRRAQYFAAQSLQLQKGEKLRIALIVASPSDLPPASHQPIQESLEKLAQEKVNLIELLPILQNADPESIDKVLSQAPHIVHFIGYCGFQNDQGQEVGVFLVDTGLNQAMWVEADYFSELLNRHRPSLVILQANQSGSLSASQAFTGVASKVLQQNIPVVVAMQYEVSDGVSRQFPFRFYEKLVEGYPVDIAAQYGRRAISLGSTRYKKRDFATPVIFMRVEDGYLFERYEDSTTVPSAEVRESLETFMPEQRQAEQSKELPFLESPHDTADVQPSRDEPSEILEKDTFQNGLPLELFSSKTSRSLPSKIRDVVVAFLTDFEAVQEQIKVLNYYKGLHDSLHTLEFQCLNSLAQEVNRSSQEEAHLEILISCRETLEEVLDDVNSLVVELISSSESLWIKHLETARNSLTSSIDLQNTIASYLIADQVDQRQFQIEKEQKIELAINLINHILSTIPPTINTKLNIIARSLRLIPIIEKSESIQDELKDSESALGKTSHLQSRINSLSQLNCELTLLIQKHDEWQAIDSRSRMIEVTTVQGFSNLEISWPFLKAMSEVQYSSLSEEWAVGFRKECENLERAILTNNKVATKSHFKKFRRRVSYRFYKVDKDLKSLCTNLWMVSESLALALRMML